MDTTLRGCTCERFRTAKNADARLSFRVISEQVAR